MTYGLGDDNCDVLLTELADVGELFDYLMRIADGEVPRLELRAQLGIARNIAAGMAQLHRVGVIHRDLAARNVLLFRMGDQIVGKVADYGLSSESRGAMYEQDSDELPYLWMPPVRSRIESNCRIGSQFSSSASIALLPWIAAPLHIHG